MACIFPSAIVNDIRKCVDTGAPWKKRDIRFPGDVILPITVEDSPGTQVIGLSTTPIWCSSCGDELPKGLGVISFWFDFHPGDPRSGPHKNWMHIGKCKHAGDGVEK